MSPRSAATCESWVSRPSSPSAIVPNTVATPLNGLAPRIENRPSCDDTESSCDRTLPIVSAADWMVGGVRSSVPANDRAVALASVKTVEVWSRVAMMDSTCVSVRSARLPIRLLT